MPKMVWFTEKEEKIIEALILKGSYRKASEYLKTQGLEISEGSMRQTTVRIRSRMNNAITLAEKGQEYQARLTKNFGRKHRFIVDR